MNTITLDTYNIGGLAKIWLIPSHLIASIRNSPGSSLYYLPTGWDALAWEFTPVFQSGAFTEELKTAGAGNYYESSVSFKFPKITGSTRDLLRNMSSIPMAILFLTQNGQYLLVGNQDYPMRLQASSKTGADISDLNHIALTYTGKNPDPALYCADPFKLR